MTGKRFIVSIDDKNGVGFYDGDIRLLYFQFNNIQDATKCKDALKHQCSLMNELHEENEELKKRLSDLQKENYGNIDGIAFYQEENASLCEKISDLKCENEELKQENKELQRQTDTQKWVNDKISYLEKKYEFGQTEYKGCPMHNIQFGINILKELQRYLEGQEK